MIAISGALVAAGIVVVGTSVWIGLCIYRDLFGEQS